MTAGNEAVEKINFADVHYRHDIAWRALKDKQSKSVPQPTTFGSGTLSRKLLKCIKSNKKVCCNGSLVVEYCKIF